MRAGLAAGGPAAGWCAAGWDSRGAVVRCDSRYGCAGRYGMGFFDSPTREIALALYTGGFRPGLLANFVSKLPGPLATVVELNDVELTIRREQPRMQASASVVVAGNDQKLGLEGELKTTSAVRLEETLVKADFFGQSADLQGPFRTRRSLFTTFLDDDILIVRDETGVPDIWLRKVH